MGVFGHEIGHSMYGDDEATAGYLGSRFADAYTDGLWINGEDSKLGSWNVADGNSLYVGQNGVDFSGVKNRDDCGPLCLTVFGIGAIISGIGAYKGGEAKAIVDYGYLGNNEYMRPDGSHISGEDLEANLKIYGTMDVGGSLLMATVPFMEGSFSKKGLGGNPFKGKNFKQSEKIIKKHGGVKKGDNPIAGKGSYIYKKNVNEKTIETKYYIDKGGNYRKGYEGAHIDVIRNGNEATKYRLFLNGEIKK